MFNSILRLFVGLIVKYSQISSSSREFQKKNNGKFLKNNLIDIWCYLKSFLRMVENLKVIFRSKNRKGYRSLIIRSTHSLTSCDQNAINVLPNINVKIITSDFVAHTFRNKKRFEPNLYGRGPTVIQRDWAKLLHI